MALTRGAGLIRTGSRIPGGARRAKRRGGPLDVAVDTFVREAGAERLLLMNRSGRVLVERGFADSADVMKASTLAAGIHATGKQMGLLVGDARVAQLHNEGTSREFMLSELWTPPGPILLLTVFQPTEKTSQARTAFASFARTLGTLAGVTDSKPVTAQEFEASLMDSLERLFPHR